MSIEVLDLLKVGLQGASDLINQVAWFLAIGQATKWLSLSLPALVLFSVIMKVNKNTKPSDEKTKEVKGVFTIIGWLLFAFTVYTGTHGLGHLLQASLAPSIYVADNLGVLKDITEKTVVGK